MFSQYYKRIIVFVVFIVFILCSCTKYSEEWDYNESEHWHSLISGNTDVAKKDIESHDWEIGVINPSCVDDGYSVYKCKVCGYSMKKDEMESLGHDYVLIMTTPPTCDKEGYDTYKCTRCGDSFDNNKTNPLGHNYLIKETVSPTCNLPGYDLYECSLCNRQTKDHFVFDYSDHEFVDGICRNCGCLAPELCVEISSKGTIRIKDELQAQSKSAYIPKRFVLPDSINGITVKAIQDNGFSNCSFEEVVLPDTIESIGKEAFSNCSNLKKITLPNNLKKLGSETFLRCTSLEECVLPDSINAGEYGSRLFEECYGLKKVFVGGNFGYSSSSSVYTYLWFGNCPNLEEITVSTMSKAYMSIDGIVYSHDKSQLVYCPRGRSEDVVVPNGTKEIYSSAFSGCKNIKSINLSSSVNRIGDYAFSGCQQLEILEFDNVTKIGDSAFYNCTSIKELELNYKVKSLGSEVFSGWGKDQTIIIKTGISDGCTGKEGTSSGYDAVSAWKDCNASIILSFDSQVKEIGYRAFWGCQISGELFLPLELTSIDDYAFYGCEIESITFPSTLTQIGQSAFAWTNLREVEISSSISSIGKCVFSYCQDLERVTWNASYIPYGAFQACLNLSTVILSDELKNIDNDSFVGCNSLETIVVPNPKTTIQSRAFFDSSFAYNDYSNPDLVVIRGDTLEKGSVVNGIALIPEGVKKIGERAFEETTINYLTFPSTLTEIGEHAFYKCDGPAFNDVVIPDSVKTIGSAAFCGIFDLKSVSLNAETIGKYAFSACPYLESVKIGKNLKKIGEGAFWLNYTDLHYYNDFSKWEAARKKMTITYEGSEIEWISRVSKESGWNEYIKDDEIGDFYFLQ